MNRIYGIIEGKFDPGLQLVLKGNEDYPAKSKIFESIWLMKETKNSTAGFDIKINKSTSLCHCIRGFINTRKVKTETNYTFKLCFSNIYETMELTGKDNILLRKNSPITGVRNQQKRNNCKLNRRRKYDSCSVLTRIDTVYHWSRWVTGKTWAWMNITSQPHWTWIFWSTYKLEWSGTNNPIMIIVAVEEVFNKKYVWDSLFLCNDRKTPMETPKKIQH